MNRHIFIDNITASLAGLLAGKKKFFAQSLSSPTFGEHIAAIQLEAFSITGEGIYEIKANSLVGELDPAFMVAQWRGLDYPSLIYHHGNNERPFDFTKSSKNTFYKIFAGELGRVEANLIVVRAPFHNSKISYYQDKMTELSNFVAMISTSVRLNEALVQYLKKESGAGVITSGISLGGWVSNLHRGVYNSATAYVPLMAGVFLGDLFLKSKYRKLASDLALNNPEQIKGILNFDELFKTRSTPNLFPLLGRFDQFIDYEVQKESYPGYPLKTIDYGHVTGALNSKILRAHILEVLKNCTTSG